MIGRIAFFALIPDQSFGTTMTFAGFTMTVVSVTTTLAFLTLTTVYRTAPVTVLARVTVRTSSQILKLHYFKNKKVLRHIKFVSELVAMT